MTERPLRCFVAAPLSAELTQALLEAGAAIRDEDATWRGEKWVPPSNLHLTLRFIGDVEPERVESIAATLGDVVGRTAGFDLELSHLRATPHTRRARMIWAELLDPSGACGGLAAALDASLVGLGFAAETRPFSPHVTLCRARRPHRLASLALESANALVDAVDGSMSVPSATLFTSRLAPRGPVYTEAATWRLMGERPRTER